MGCQSQVDLGENLTFTITTHDPDTGVLTDADFAPTYRVYEDETAAALLNGTMTILDNVNTTGFYSELIACTAANGFEHNRSYNIYIEATVDGDTGGISYGFRAYSPLTAAQVANALLGHAVITTALRTATDLTLYRGDTWTQVITGMGDLTAATDIWFGVKTDPDDTDNEALVLISETVGLERINGAAAAVPGNGSITVIDAAGGIIQVDLDEVETAKLVPDKRFWDAQKLVTGTVTTPRAGRISVIADIVRATS
jgi:hypothetical protein